MPAGARCPSGRVAALTHAAIAARFLPRFWRRVPVVAAQAASTPGFSAGFGFGAVPLVGLATFSVWDSEDDLRAFAWGDGPHARTVAGVRAEGWFREEFFAVFDVARALPAEGGA
jgi:hypothetical protein